MNNCLFCDFSKNKNYVCDAGNFYILVGKGIITDGHCMIVSKKHYSCFGEMDTKLLSEYKELKDRLIKFIEKKYSKPFVLEHGVFGQSVFHAHSHFIPSCSGSYRYVNIINDMVFPAIKKWNFKFSYPKDVSDLSNFFNVHKEYLYFEQDSQKILLNTNGYDIKKVKFDIIYRQFFLKLGLQGIGNWKEMTDEEKKNDKIKIINTKNGLLDFV